MNCISMQKQIHVLLLDGHTVQSFSVAKALRDSHMYVTLFCSKKMSYGYVSKYPNKKIKCPSEKGSSKDYITFLINYIKDNKTDVIIPLFDDSADLLNIYRKKIESYGVKVALPSKEQYKLARNKTLLMQFCKVNNISHPISMPVNKNNYKNVADFVGFPSLIKPNNLSGAVGIVHVNSITQLSKFFSDDKSNNQFLLQSYVPNSGYYFNAMLFRSKNGRFSKIVIIKILRYFPVKGGTGTYNETVEYCKIETICKSIMNKLNWVGFADIDFIVDNNTLEPKLIEINPRIPACIHSAYVSGINFPEIIVHDILGRKIPEQHYLSGQKVRYLAMDILWFIFSKHRFKTKPSWFKFLGKNLHYQDGNFKDSFTMIAGILMGLKKYLNQDFRKSKLTNI